MRKLLFSRYKGPSLNFRTSVWKKLDVRQHVVRHADASTWSEGGQTPDAWRVSRNTSSHELV